MFDDVTDAIFVATSISSAVNYAVYIYYALSANEPKHANFSDNCCSWNWFQSTIFLTRLFEEELRGHVQLICGWSHLVLYTQNTWKSRWQMYGNMNTTSYSIPSPHMNFKTTHEAGVQWVLLPAASAAVAVAFRIGSYQTIFWNVGVFYFDLRPGGIVTSYGVSRIFPNRRNISATNRLGS